MELVVVLAVLSVVMIVVAQVATWSMFERLRLAAHLAATELAANVLEAARAEPPEALTPAWAAAHQQPAQESALPPEHRVLVRVEPEKAAPGACRVTVEVRWSFNSDQPEYSVQMVSVFAPRAAEEGKR
jgi:type II secretory pathway pseudopilin PulG